ncbi:hypothetical protein [Actinomadura livida]|uniref:Uncharacterized protein n=1 Tax=Actinomadura livida TaxID=79909 RepID=A0A7W7IK37_9ACTN|nr:MULTISPECIES: hypothetical protein [Actinomadura]MBB4778381.1 hypothetical protein [Actinomadura catellatispora]
MAQVGDQPDPLQVVLRRPTLGPPPDVPGQITDLHERPGRQQVSDLPIKPRLPPPRPTLPLLWVHAQATKGVGIVVSVLATPGRTWAYHEAQWGRRGYLCLCGDPEAAAAQVDRLLKHRLFPSTW